MSVYEIEQYMVFYDLYPFGERRDDFRAAQICQQLSPKKKDNTATTPADFMPYLQQEIDFANQLKPATVKGEEAKQRLTSIFGHMVKKKNAKR